MKKSLIFMVATIICLGLLGGLIGYIMLQTDPVPIETSPPPKADPLLMCYFIYIEQDGERWHFRGVTKDTTLVHRFCYEGPGPHWIRIGITAVNWWFEETEISWSDTHWVRPDTLKQHLEATTGTDYNWLSPPPDLAGLDSASDLMAYVENNTLPPADCKTVSEWNATAQAYTWYYTFPDTATDFPLSSEGAYRVEMNRTTTLSWPVYACGLERWDWGASKDDMGY